MGNLRLNWKYLALFALLTFGATLSGRYLSFFAGSGPPTFWPATGIYFAFMLATRVRDWGKVAAVSFAAVVLADLFSKTFNFPDNIYIWTIKSVVLFGGAYFLRLITDDSNEKTYRSGLALVFIGGVVVPALAAAFTCLIPPTNSIETTRFLIWRFHFAGSSIGVLTTTPFLLLVLDWFHRGKKIFDLKNLVFDIGLACLAFAMTNYIFSPTDGAPDPFRTPFMLFSVLVAIAFRGKSILTAGTNLGVSLIIIWHTIQAHGLAATFLNPVDAMTAIQLLLATLILTDSLLTAAVYARTLVARSLAEKTQELEQVNHALAEAKEIALAASEAKSSFLANLSHEIRSPLGAMMGYADLLLEEHQQEEDRRHFAEIIKRNSVHLGELINQILDLSKIEAGKLDIEIEPIEVRELIDEVMQLVGLQAKEKKLELKSTVSLRTPKIICTDELRLRQILLNVLNNAIKFTSTGSVTLSVDAERVRGRWKLICDVEDTGIGMSIEEQQRLFLSFSQATRSTAKHYGGTGLGLVLSRQLAQLLGGTFELTCSEKGVGSVFRLRIDGGESVFAMMMPEAKTLESDRITASSLAGLRILVAEDAIENQLLVRRYLELAGATVSCVENGRKAVEVALEHHHDLVLMDIEMPEMDGMQAVRLLRAKGFQAPVVALTGRAMQSDIEECLQNGFDDHILKPINREVLIGCVLGFINQLSVGHTLQVSELGGGAPS